MRADLAREIDPPAQRRPGPGPAGLIRSGKQRSESGRPGERKKDDPGSMLSPPHALSLGHPLQIDRRCRFSVRASPLPRELGSSGTSSLARESRRLCRTGEEKILRSGVWHSPFRLREVTVKEVIERKRSLSQGAKTKPDVLDKVLRTKGAG